MIDKLFNVYKLVGIYSASLLNIKNLGENFFFDFIYTSTKPLLDNFNLYERKTLKLSKIILKL